MAEYNADTPFVDQNLRNLKRNNAAFADALKLLKERPFTVIESFGGIGSQSLVIQEEWPGIAHAAYERDQRCWAKLAKIPGVWAYSEPWDRRDVRLPNPGTLLVMDCNDLSLLPEKFSRWVQYELPENYRGALIVTDVARGKLHLNYKSYGLESPDIGTYLRAFATRLGRQLRGATHSGGLSYLVFEGLRK